jgi:hypothetical protein
MADAGLAVDACLALAVGHRRHARTIARADFGDHDIDTDNLIGRAVRNARLMSGSARVVTESGAGCLPTPVARSASALMRNPVPSPRPALESRLVSTGGGNDGDVPVVELRVVLTQEYDPTGYAPEADANANRRLPLSGPAKLRSPATDADAESSPKLTSRPAARIYVTRP